MGDFGADHTPRLTVVSGYYNRAGATRSSTQSVLDQTFTDFEYLVFDDASTDDTLNVLRSFADPRIRVIPHASNMGFVRGMIDALARARGEYIAVHGAGDLSLPRRLELQADYLDRHPDVGVVSCYRSNVSTAGVVHFTVRPDPDALTFERLLRTNSMSHGEVMFRRASFESVGGYRALFTYAQDRDLWLRLSRITRFGVVPKVLYHRVVHPDGLSFVPEKIVRQWQLSHLAVVLAQATPEVEHDLFERAVREGVDSVVPPDHPALRRRLLHKVAVLAVAGRWAEADDLARRVSVRGARGAVHRSTVRLFTSLGRRFDARGERLSRLLRWLTNEPSSPTPETPDR